MPILDIQKRFRELGRIRTGIQVDTGKTYDSGPRKGQAKMRPTKLPRFRLTSPWPPFIEEAAAVFGGEPRPWDNGGNEEWEVVIEREKLPILVPPGVDILDQWYERWTGGGCLNRCDGIRQTLVDAPCRCPKDHEERTLAAAKNPPQACKPTTRLRVMVPDISDVGIWRLESHGFHAAAELGGAAALIEVATRQGVMIPADLLLVPAEGARRPDTPRKKFYVPAISFRDGLGTMLEALGMGATGDTPVYIAGAQPRPALNTGGVPELPRPSTPFDPSPPVETGGLPPAPPEVLASPAPPPTTAPEDLPAPGPPLPTEETSVDRPETLPEPTTFDPPPYEPPETERSFSGPQLIAMKLGDRGVKDRGEKLAIVARMVGREVSSSKELTPAEVRSVLDRLNDDGYGLPLGPPASTTTETTSTTEPAPPPARSPEVLRGDVVDPAPAPSRGVADLQASARLWSPDAWRTFLADHRVKPLELFAEARRAAVELEEDPPASLDALLGCSEDLIGLLVLFVRERGR